MNNCKIILTLLLLISFSTITVAQREYDEFVQALSSGDTILAKKISDNITTTESIQTKSFPIKNIPEHVFNFQIDKLKDTIVGLFNIENQMSNKILGKVFYNVVANGAFVMPLTFQAETKKDTVFSRKYFSKPNTSNDIFLHDFREVWLSKFYFSGDHPLEYTANFIVKLDKINNNSTKISILADEPEVINGAIGMGVHGPVARYTSVNPTTIEEYILLEFIASKLSDTTLLPLKLPVE
ncbi:hypothetical protein [Ferruginibacter albus]|uniref:hypothetical protein n=1 Tax=Ferruginibacter albus TaxID=2875540 RepID=UPI001CC5CA0F|nr:hypothetical protein [Ferruginibacter albus]UAY53038.1 hypothetical protein K9M53_05000 [Ferruginibacter albus]